LGCIGKVLKGEKTTYRYALSFCRCGCSLRGHISCGHSNWERHGQDKGRGLKGEGSCSTTYTHWWHCSGYKPFVEACIDAGEKGEALKYIPKLADPRERAEVI